MTTIEYLRTLKILNKSGVRIYFNEFAYPSLPPGSKPHIGKFFSLGSKAFKSTSELESTIEKLPANTSLGIASLVKVGNKTWYLPMMDFAIPKSKQAIEIIRSNYGKIITPKFGGGVLIETDNSYHFLGNKLLTKKQLQSFINWSLVASAYKKDNHLELLCDTQFIGYWLLKNNICIRISPRTNGPWPKVVSTL